MIKEKDIVQIAEQISTMDFESLLMEIKQNYPLIHSYLLNEQMSLLSEEEYQLLWFDAMVILKSCERCGNIQKDLDQARLEDYESDNWAKFENSKPAGFRDKLDVFFNETDQEDLLAFIEDSLADDDEMQVSSAAKEIIFIVLKSLVDLLTETE